MARPNTYFLVNNTSNDGANTGNASGGAGGNSSNWVLVDLTNDTLTHRDSQQSDGDADDGPSYPPIIPSSGTIEAPKTFLVDDSAGELDQLPLAGTSDGDQDGGDNQYVFAMYFDGATATPPYLEMWDDENLDTAAGELLGGGTPADSHYQAVATTDGAPGSATWSGTPLAGSSSRVQLASAALASAQNVYFNWKRTIPSTLATLSASPVMAVRFTHT